TNDLQCDTALIVPNTAHSLAAGTIVNFEVRGLDDGRPYYFCIRAFDESNNRSSWNGTLTATTPQANEAPIVDAGLDTNATLGESVQLSAALSSDPDATACGASSGQYVYQWTLTNAPASSQLSSADIVNSDQMDAYFVPDVAGTYVVQLSLTDDAGSCTGGDRTDVDSTHILVSAAVPPTNLSVQLLKNGLEVTWDAAAGISEYELFYSTTSPVVLSDPSFSSSGTLFLITQILEGGKTYYFALASRYDGGLSELGDEVSFFLPDQICGNATISFPEQCDDGNTNNGDGCSTNCEVEFAFQCTNGDPSVCTAPNDLGTFGVGDTIQPLSGPPLAAGETANYFVSVVEAVSISATLQATTGDPDLAFFKCDGTGIANFSSPGDETMSDYFFGPSCYVVRITAVSDLPNGFLLTQTINAP
ncbi:MAG: hypothetical protein KDK37_02670, partial [Leptospiraceae bacterium]|nr:hypothetical protein [Leptospiraceae bacterium]